VELKSDLDFLSIEIAGERILLSPISLSASNDIYREFTNEITRYMFPSSPSDISQINSFIEMSVEGMNNQTDLVLKITNLESGDFLGVCGIHSKGNPRAPELGIWLKKSVHLNHYGREAISFLVKWAQENIVFNHLIYPVDRDNIPSIKVAEFLGGEIVGESAKESMSGTILNEITYKIS